MILCSRSQVSALKIDDLLRPLTLLKCFDGTTHKKGKTARSFYTAKVYQLVRRKESLDMRCHEQFYETFSTFYRLCDI